MANPTGTVKFNGSILASGVGSATYSRAGAAYTQEAGTVASGDYLAGRTATIAAPRPAWTSGYTFTGSPVWLGSGFDHNNSDEAVAFIEANDDIKVFETDLDTPTRTLDLTTSGNRDLLKGAVSGYRHTPYAGKCIHGLWVIACEKINTGDDDTERISVCVNQDNFATTPTLHADGDELAGDATHHGKPRGREWAIDWVPVEGDATAPTKIAVTLTDYMYAPNKVGGQAYLLFASRTTTTGTWTVDSMVKVYEELLSGMHFHAAIYDPTTESVRIFAGDAYAANVVYEATPDDGIDNYDTTAWTVTAINGATGANGEAAGQFIGQIYKGGGEFIQGGDVMPNGLVKTKYNSGSLDISRVYGSATVKGDIYESLFIHGRPVTGPAVARHNPYSADSLSADLYRVLFSQDLENWVAIGQGDSQEAAYVPFIFKNKVGMLSDNKVEYMDQPTVATYTPLRISPGYTNLLRTGDFDLLGVNVSNSSQLVAKSSFDANAPTAHHQVIRLTGGATNIQLGRVRITDDPVVATGEVTVLIWIKAASDRTAGIRVTAGDAATSSYITPYRDFNVTPNQDWTPVIIQGDPGVGVAYDLQLQFLSDAASGQVVDYYVCVGAVVQGESLIGYGGDDDASVPASIMPVTATLNTSWTVVEDVIVPDHGWDSTFASTTHPLLSVFSDANNHQEVFADTTNNRIVQTSTDGGSATSTNSATGSARFLPGDHIRAAVINDGGDVSAWVQVNGNEIVTTTGDTLSAALDGSVTIRPCGDSDYTNVLPGDLALLRVYGSALSSAEIEGLSAIAPSPRTRTRRRGRRRFW